MAQQDHTSFEIGKERLVIMHDLLTVSKTRLLKKKIKDVKEAYDKELTDLQKTLIAIGRKYEPEYERKEEESDEEYSTRCQEITDRLDKEVKELVPTDVEPYIFEMAFRCLQALGEEFGQSQKVTRENFDAAIFPKLRLELAKFLLTNECDQVGSLFLPKKLPLDEG